MAMRSLICDHEAAYIAKKRKKEVVAAGKEAYYFAREDEKIEIERMYKENLNLLIETSVSHNIVEAYLGKDGEATEIDLGHVFRYVKSC